MIYALLLLTVVAGPLVTEPQTVVRPAGRDKAVERSAPLPRAGVATRPSKELTRFREARPMDRDRDRRPAPRREGRWHWHPWYGWILLPQTRIYADLPETLEANFQLPETVTVWQAPATTVEVICPHCGKAFRVIINH